MGDPLSTEDASDTQQFDTLEGMIKYTARDKDNEVPHTVRLEGWQLNEMDRIKSSLNTNRIEVCARAYVMGTDIMRENVGSDVEDITSMTTIFRRVSMNTRHQTDDIFSIIDELIDYNVDLKYERTGSLKDPINVRVPESYFSEVSNTYIIDAGFGKWTHRAVMAIGLSKSGGITAIPLDKSKEYIEGIKGGVEDTRVEIENIIRRYVVQNSMFWSRNGIELETYNGLEDIFEHMETSNKEDIKHFLNMDNIEIIESTGEPPPDGDS